MINIWMTLIMASSTLSYNILVDAVNKTLGSSSATFTVDKEDLNSCVCNQRYKMCDQFCYCDTDCTEQLRNRWSNYSISSTFSPLIESYYCAQSFLSNISFAKEGSSRKNSLRSSTIQKYILY